MFELYQLEQLLAVSECGTLSQAAEQLHLSQSALSRSMQRLEAELQVTLFTRQKNRIELNECGRMDGPATGSTSRCWTRRRTSRITVCTAPRLTRS